MTEYAPEDLEAVREQVQPPPVGTGPAPFTPSPPPPGTVTETDLPALLARMDEMAKQIAALQSAGAVAGEHPLIAEAKAARDLIGHHFEFHPKMTELGRLADDVVDAAVNAVASGDTGAVRKVAAALARELIRRHPGPGDNHYFANALSVVSAGIPNAADTVTAAQPSAAPAIGSSQAPARVVAGSVTG